MLVGSWPPDAVLLGARDSPLSVAVPRPAAWGLHAGRHPPRRPPVPAWAGSCAWETGGWDQPTGEVETAGDRESQREDWGWELGATKRGLGTLGCIGARRDGVRWQRRGGDGRRPTRIVGRIWFFLCCALKFRLRQNNWPNIPKYVLCIFSIPPTCICIHEFLKGH
jgi:hypothetical protein